MKQVLIGGFKEDYWRRSHHQFTMEGGMIVIIMVSMWKSTPDENRSSSWEGFATAEKKIPSEELDSYDEVADAITASRTAVPRNQTSSALVEGLLATEAKVAQPVAQVATEAAEEAS